MTNFGISGLNLSLVEPLAWKRLTIIVQLIKYVQLPGLKVRPYAPRRRLAWPF
jgi:hypothetical protein